MAWLASAKATYPVLRAAPTISGADEVGRYARLNYGDWVHYKTQLLPRNYPAQQWQRGDTASGPWSDISGAIYPIYKRTASDLNKYLRCRESRTAETGVFYTFTDPVGPTLAESRPTVDLTTRGLKTLSAVGSISSGSNTLTLTSNPGFVTGDSVIIECGAEPGAGARGTVGVGGQWPLLTYATTTAMNADTSQVSGTAAGVLATGDVYYWSGSAWVAYDPANDYYYQKVQPVALIATITAVSGTVLTLSGAGAKATATNANVYYDNAPKLAAITDDNTIFTIPAGNYRFGGRAKINVRQNLDFIGAGPTSTIFQDVVRGPPLNVWCEQSTNNVFGNIGFVGNVTDATYGCTDYTYANASKVFIGASYFHLGSGGIVDNCAYTNCWECWSASFNPNQWAVNCSATMNRQRVYIQWQSEQADSDYCGTINCSLTSDYLTAGFEFFRSRGGRHYSPTLVNATLSVNTAGDFDIFTPNVTIQENSQFDNISFNKQKSVIDINANIGNTSGGAGSSLANYGGAVWYPTVVQQGYINASNDVLTGCIIGGEYHTADGSPNVVIYGGYPLHPEQGGMFQAPDYSATSSSNGPRAVASDGDAYVIGIRAKGAPKPSPGDQANSINFSHTALGTAINCVADSILANTQSGNQTNAQYGP